MEQNDKREKLIKYVKATVILLTLIIVTYFIEKPFEEETLGDVFGKISNCFTVPGVLFTGIAGLSYISFLGGYDSVGYIMKNYALQLILPRHTKKYDSLYDYKVEKDKAGRKWMPHVLVVGLVSLFLGVVFLIVYLVL